MLNCAWLTTDLHRSLQNFEIGGPEERMPMPLINGMAILKKAAATVNKQFGLKPDISRAIVQAADEVSEV